MIKPLQALIFGLAIGCSPKVINQSTVKERDSLAVKIVHHHDTIRIAGETVLITKVITDTVSFRQEKKIGRADVVLINKHGKLTADCKCDSIQIAKDFALKDTMRFKFKETTNTRTIIKTVTTGFDKFCRWFFIACCCAASIVLAFKFKSIFY